MLLLAIALTVFLMAGTTVDLATSGGVRAEVSGGVRGAGRGLWAYEKKVVRDARARRRKRLSKTWTGRLRLALEDEIWKLVREVAAGWRRGAHDAHERRRARRAARTTEPNDTPPDPTVWPYADEDAARTPPNETTETPRTPERTGADQGVRTPDSTSNGTAPDAEPTPDQTAPDVVRTPGYEGVLVADFPNAVALIAHWEKVLKRLREEQTEIAVTAKLAAQGANPGKLDIGGGEDTSSAVRTAFVATSRAVEAVEIHLRALYAEYRRNIEAAEGTKSEALAPVRES